ncbi:hypothetical protein AVEN_129131-1 [Araneus ventricosus]|uniref:Uncharacterized protein n=1 Tax=Araneus ventricosus TaxID=182803 RepID=A0A4Y2RY76_ARAVE|nr:hypothetical protein AVEN_129131-1 [Araneus ventricosus]
MYEMRDFAEPEEPEIEPRSRTVSFPDHYSIANQQLCIVQVTQWFVDEISASELEGFRLKSRFHLFSIVYVGLIQAKYDVRIKRLPLLVAWKFEEDIAFSGVVFNI